MKYIIMAVHILIALILLIVTNPVSSHVITKTAYKNGVMPKFVIVNVLKEDEEEYD